MSKRTVLKRINPDPYEPISHEDWEIGEVVVNVRTGGIAVTQARKRFPDDDPFPGWWVLDTNGFPGGGIADFVKDWRSLKCLLAERKHFGL